MSYETDGTTNGTTESEKTVQQNAKNGTTESEKTDTNKNVFNKNKEEEINRGKGDLHPLYDSPPAYGVIKAADGSMVKIPVFEFKAENFNGLPERECMSVINLLLVLKQVNVSKQDLDVLWESFKILELPKKVYRNREDVYSFFSNFCKRQTWRKENVKKERTKKTKPDKTEKIFGIEWINNFTQCRMSDGSLVNLDQNQQDQAQYSLISPSVIEKK